MPGPDERARGDDLNVYLDWSPGEDAEAEGPQASAPTARSLFLGQLPDNQPDDAWADYVSDSEQFESEASFETEFVEPDEVPAGESDQFPAPGVDERIGDATAPVPPVVTAAVPRTGGREARRAARNQRARLRHARIAVVMGVIAAVVAGTAVYVGTRANGGDQRARQPTSTSFERQSSSTTPTTVAGSDPAPGTEPAPDPAGAPGASPPTSPQGTSSAPAAAPGSAVPTSPRTPSSTAAPPNTAAPPSSPPPRSPTCQLLPVVCP
jgi:hypothetical protein